VAIRDPNDRFRIQIPTLPNDNKSYINSSSRYELKIHEVAPEDIEPLGDRYVVEVIDIDEKIELGQILVVTQQPKEDNSPMADPTVERRGVLAAVVVSVGNGHLLGIKDEVPMFYSVGDCVLVDHNAKGRALKIVGRECRIVNQIDCLARLPMRLVRVDGEWIPEE